MLKIFIGEEITVAANYTNSMLSLADAQVYNSHIAICLAGKKLFKCKYCPKQFSRRSGKL